MLFAYSLLAEKEFHCRFRCAQAVMADNESFANCAPLLVAEPMNHTHCATSRAEPIHHCFNHLQLTLWGGNTKPFVVAISLVYAPTGVSQRGE